MKKIIKKTLAIGGGLALAGAITLGLAAYYALHRPGPSAGVVIRVPRGLGARQVGRLLEEKGVIRNRAQFNAAIRFPRRGHLLRAGLYDIPSGSSLVQVIERLTGGPTAVLRVTIPEGAASWEIADILAQKDLVPSREDFLTMVEQEELEGFLFPDTYLVPSDFAPEGIARLFTRNFDNQWSPGWDDQAMRLGMDRREIVTLASIIEREAGTRLEKKIVSSVFHNRLRRGMALQACPTVLYALGSWQAPLTGSLIRQTDSPYNTYLRRGLPPGPIANPGREALEATLYPDSTEYLFFVSNRDGSHSFSRTYREHNLAITRIRREAEEAQEAREREAREMEEKKMEGTDEGYEP